MIFMKGRQIKFLNISVKLMQFKKNYNSDALSFYQQLKDGYFPGVFSAHAAHLRCSYGRRCWTVWFDPLRIKLHHFRFAQRPNARNQRSVSNPVRSRSHKHHLNENIQGHLQRRESDEGLPTSTLHCFQLKWQCWVK